MQYNNVMYALYVFVSHRRKIFPVLFSCASSARRLPAHTNITNVSGLVTLVPAFTEEIILDSVIIITLHYGLESDFCVL